MAPRPVWHRPLPALMQVLPQPIASRMEHRVGLEHGGSEHLVLLRMLQTGPETEEPFPSRQRPPQPPRLAGWDGTQGPVTGRPRQQELGRAPALGRQGDEKAHRWTERREEHTRSRTSARVLKEVSPGVGLGPCRSARHGTAKGDPGLQRQGPGGGVVAVTCPQM